MMLDIPLPMWIEKQMKGFTGEEPTQEELFWPCLTEGSILGVGTAKTKSRMNKMQGKVIK